MLKFLCVHTLVLLALLHYYFAINFSVMYKLCRVYTLNLWDITSQFFSVTYKVRNLKRLLTYKQCCEDVFMISFIRNFTCLAAVVY